MVQKSRLLRKGFEIETNKSWTIIPQYPPTSELSLDAVSTLRKLETLSKVSAFELYTATISEFNRLYSKLKVSWKKERKKREKRRKKKRTASVVARLSTADSILEAGVRRFAVRNFKDCMMLQVIHKRTTTMRNLGH